MRVGIESIPRDSNNTMTRWLPLIQFSDATVGMFGIEVSLQYGTALDFEVRMALSEGDNVHSSSKNHSELLCIWSTNLTAPSRCSSTISELSTLELSSPSEVPEAVHQAHRHSTDDAVTRWA